MIYTGAKYTAVLNNLLQDEKTRTAINNALSHYPMYTPTSKNEYIPKVIPTREELNQKILNHYKYREIGFETVGRFIDELDIAMCEIMPYYNQLMFTQDQDFNIIYNVDYQRTIDTTKDGEKSENVSGETSSNGENESTNTSTTTGSTTNNTSANSNDSSTINSTVNHNNKNVQSETPSNDVIGITADKIESVSYADKVSWNKDTNTDDSTTTGESNSTTTGESESTSSNTGEIKGSSSNSSEMTSITTGTTKDIESTLETTKGNFGVVSAQDLISKYRDIIINIEQMIINDKRLSELFMLVY